LGGTGIKGLIVSLSCLAAWAGDGKLPLPEAPVRVLIPDVKAFDGALTGAYRRFATGKAKAGDPLLSAWRKTQVGSKLEDQWSRFSEFLPLTWEEIRKLQTTSMGFALLEAGHLEAVLLLDTPLAALPASFPKGERKTYGGVTYALVAKGAADASENPDRRMGLAWARVGQRLFLATSERALKLALDESLAGRGMAPPLAGFVSMELDLDALRKDRYFKREFPFPDGPETGKLRAALRKEGEDLVEVREGTTEPRGAVPSFRAPEAAAAGWEPEGSDFWPPLRRGLLDSVPNPSDRPVPLVKPLPNPAPDAPEDRYAVDLTRPRATTGDSPWEAGDLGAWKGLLQRLPVSSWGYWIGKDGSRRLVFPWPEAQDQAFLDACRATLARRAGPTTVANLGDAREIQVGAGIPVFAIRRTGAFLWVASAAKDLQGAPAPKTEPGLVRWASVDLSAVRAEAPRWAKVEGPSRPEQMRPLSDRVLGLLGWMPATSSISVERRKTPAGWTETVRFGAAAK
jgi:hypothetical protein